MARFGVVCTSGKSIPMKENVEGVDVGDVCGLPVMCCWHTGEDLIPTVLLCFVYMHVCIRSTDLLVMPHRGW